MYKTAFLFPGQGSQYIGMGSDFISNHLEAAQAFEEAAEILKFDLLRLCLEGPAADLIKTENAQPAILTTSIAILRVLEKEGLMCDVVAGLSLGEYTALVKAGALKFADAVKITRERGLLMQEAVKQGLGGMAAIMGLNIDLVHECIAVSKQFGIVEIANYNAPGQIVLSGHKIALKHAISKAKEIGAKNAVLLPVSGPFHSSLMEPVSKLFKKKIDNITIDDLAIPLVANYSANIITKKKEVIDALIAQIHSTVLWNDTIELMINNGVDLFVEIGPGEVLTNILKRIAEYEDKIIQTHKVDRLNDLREVMRLIF